jgi:hypothetical protein
VRGNDLFDMQGVLIDCVAAQAGCAFCCPLPTLKEWPPHGTSDDCVASRELLIVPHVEKNDVLIT